VDPEPAKLDFGIVPTATAWVAAAATTAAIASSAATGIAAASAAAAAVSACIAAVASLLQAALAGKLVLDFGESSFHFRVAKLLCLGLSQTDEQARQSQRRPIDGRLHP